MAVHLKSYFVAFQIDDDLIEVFNQQTDRSSNDSNQEKETSMQHDHFEEKRSNFYSARIKGELVWLATTLLAAAIIAGESAGETNKTVDASIPRAVQRTGYDRSRLTPEQRKELAQRLSQHDPEFLRNLTNSTPRAVKGGTNRVAEHINAALKR